MFGWTRVLHGAAGVLFAAAFAFSQVVGTAAANDPSSQRPSSQSSGQQPPQASPKSAAELYADTCAACHGADGKGRDRIDVGFDIPLPDFTDCSFASREADLDWLSVVHSGGPARRFSPVMPAFGLALPESDLLRVIGHVRTFCGERAWPRGELNLPRAFLTEKAFPEDEAVLTTSVAARGSAAVAATLVYERRFGARNQIEIKLPIESFRDTSGWTGGAGDLSLGVKRAIAHSLSRGSILAVAGEIQIPTGRDAAGLSKNTAVFEPYVAFGQVLPLDAFLQIQAGAEFPFNHARAEREAFARVAVGQTFTQNLFGRSWTPMIEVEALRDIEPGARINWSVAPQLQVSLSRRQHVLLSVGVQVPVGPRNGRQPQLMFYLLWDWFDGGFFSGW